MVAAVAQAFLRVVQPAAIEAAIVAREEDVHKHDEVLAALQRDLQAARYAAQRAQKQYDAADPENRLVADELERRWNDALVRVAELESRIGQQSYASGQLPPAQPEEFTDLAAALESIWPQADARLKKRIVRTLIHEVVVDVDDTTRQARSYSSFTGRAASIQKSAYRAGAVARTPLIHPRKQLMPCANSHASVRIC